MAPTRPAAAGLPGDVPLWTVPYRMAVVGAGAAIAGAALLCAGLDALGVIALAGLLGVEEGTVLPAAVSVFAVGAAALFIGGLGGSAEPAVIIIGEPPADVSSVSPTGGSTTPLATPEVRRAPLSPEKQGWGRRRGHLTSKPTMEADDLDVQAQEALAAAQNASPDAATPQANPPAAVADPPRGPSLRPPPLGHHIEDAETFERKFTSPALGSITSPAAQPVLPPSVLPPSPRLEAQGGVGSPRGAVGLVIQSPSPEPFAPLNESSNTSPTYVQPPKSPINTLLAMKSPSLMSPGSPSLRRQGNDSTRALLDPPSFLRSPGSDLSPNLRRISSKHERKQSATFASPDASLAVAGRKSSARGSMLSIPAIDDGSGTLAVPGPASPREAELQARERHSPAVRRVPSRHGSMQPMRPNSPLRLDNTSGGLLNATRSSPQMRRISSKIEKIEAAPEGPASSNSSPLRSPHAQRRGPSFGTGSPMQVQEFNTRMASKSGLTSGAGSPKVAGSPPQAFAAIRSHQASPRSTPDVQPVLQAAAFAAPHDAKLQAMLQQVETSANQNEKLAKEVIRALRRVQDHEQRADRHSHRSASSREKRRRRRERSSGAPITINVNAAAPPSPRHAPTQPASPPPTQSAPSPVPDHPPPPTPPPPVPPRDEALSHASPYFHPPFASYVPPHAAVPAPYRAYPME